MMIVRETPMPSPASWGRDGDWGDDGSTGSSDSAVRTAPPSLALPHEGGGEELARTPVSARQRAQAKRLRRALTPAERKLWHALEAHRFQGLHIRRQVPMGPHIADFVCHSAGLVIEVDGAQHGFAQHVGADRQRDAWFASQGYRALRFWNRDVLTGLESVRDTVLAYCPPDLPSAGDPQ